MKYLRSYLWRRCQRRKKTLWCVSCASFWESERGGSFSKPAISHLASSTGCWGIFMPRLGNPSPPGVERSLAPWILERERGAALQIFWRAKRRRASLLPLLVHSTPWGKGNITIITLSPCCYWGIKLTFITYKLPFRWNAEVWLRWDLGKMNILPYFHVSVIC